MLTSTAKDTSERVLKQFKIPLSTPNRVPEDWFHYSLKRGREEIFHEVIELTPEIAKLLLANNNDNRKISQATVDTFAADIKAGRWDLNGESLKIARDGSLNDGQHRCLGVLAANASMKTVATFGLDRSSRMTLDQGRVRGVGDYLQMEAGVKYANDIASAARILWSVRHKHDYAASPKSGATKTALRAEYWANQKELDSAAQFVGSNSGGKRVLGGRAPSIAALVSMRRQYASADDFMQGFLDGANLKTGDARLTLRSRLLGPQVHNPVFRYNMLMRSFSAWLDGRALQRIPAKTRKTKAKS